MGRRILMGILAFVVILAVAFKVIVHRPFPDIRGTITVAGPDAPVEIVRDENGVPHIYAESERDAYFAQGFVHAQDRFWQMEFWRRIGAGRLSEYFGEPTLDTDRFIRTMGFSHIVRDEWEILSPDVRTALQAYADGVNAWIMDKPPSRLGLEFFLLKLQGVDVEIEPWEPYHTLTWLKIMAYDLGGNMQAELDRLALIRLVGIDKAMDFYPLFRGDEMPNIVTDQEVARFLDTRSMNIGDADQTNPANPYLAVLADPVDPAGPSTFADSIPVTLIGDINAGDPLALGKGGGIGSNSWVVSGDLTASGSPILANDTHLGIQMPSIWYEVVIHSPNLNVGGFTFAGVPGVIIGHNDAIAWGVTNADPDVQDLYVERVNPENVLEYEVEGEWQPMTVRYEEIGIAGRETPDVLVVRETRNGPIISDTGTNSDQSGFSFVPPVGVESATIMVPSGSMYLTELSLRWTAFEPNRTIESFYRINHARSFSEFRVAAELFDIPSQNLVYADVDGNIGYQLPGRIPIRRNHDGRLPVPGWLDRYQWDGYIPFEDLPWVLNPEKGYIATANQQIVSDRYPYFIQLDYDAGYRGRRIADLIESAPDSITSDYVQTMQADSYNLSAEELIPYLTSSSVLEEASRLGATLAREENEPEKAASEAIIFTEVVNRIDGLLRSWNRYMTPDSSDTVLYAFIWQSLLEETFHDEIPDTLWKRERLMGGISRTQSALYLLMKEPDNSWWDDITTPDIRETRDTILSRSIVYGWEAAVETLGDDYDKWEWGDLHTASFENQTFGKSGIGPVERLFNRGPVAVASGMQQVNSADYSMVDPFEVVHLSSMRQIVAPDNWDATLLIHTTGQSGHAFSDHYDDFIPLWSTVRYHGHRWTREALEAVSKTTRLMLKPTR